MNFRHRLILRAARLRANIVVGSLVVLGAPWMAPAVRAGDGHDHGHDHGPAAAAATLALPRAAAASETFELVAVLEGRRLKVYLDRFADNAPVAGAQLQLDMAGQRVALAEREPGAFEGELAQPLVPGVHALTATVSVAGEVDLLAADLDLSAPAAAVPHRHLSWWWVAAALAALVVLGWLAVAARRRRTRGANDPRTAVLQGLGPILGLMLGLALGLGAPSVQAGDEHGHDHGSPAAVANANDPRRLPDGSVFLPKPTQRLLNVRTLPVAETALSRSTVLSGRVVADPDAGGKVQPMTPGRLQPAGAALPIVGRAVKQGELLAWVEPAVAPAERAAQAAQLAELKAAQALAEKRLARLRLLVDSVPRKDIEAAESELASLVARGSAIAGGLSGREALRAPVSGVIAAAHAVAGQVVDARELVYEIVDPTRLGIEAMAFDATLATDIGGASLQLAGQRVPLRFVGAARVLRDQALPLHFRAEDGARDRTQGRPVVRDPGRALSALAVGQPVQVFVQSRSTVTGMAVPSAALVRSPSNQTLVWVKTAPERFEPRAVVTQPLDGATVAITAGLQPGDRVAVQAALLINQIR